jgi:hypothetical protein
MIKRKIRKGACQLDTHFPSRKSYGKMFLMKKREAEEFSSVILGSVPSRVGGGTYTDALLAHS